MNAGHERFTNRDREEVLKVMRDVRLDPELAKEILGSTVRKAFMGFISRSRNKANRLDAAKELKSLVFFSNMVVTPLLEDINVSLFSHPPFPFDLSFVPLLEDINVSLFSHPPFPSHFVICSTFLKETPDLKQGSKFRVQSALSKQCSLDSKRNCSAWSRLSTYQSL